MDFLLQLQTQKDDASKCAGVISVILVNKNKFHTTKINLVMRVTRCFKNFHNKYDNYTNIPIDKTPASCFLKLFV